MAELALVLAVLFPTFLFAFLIWRNDTNNKNSNRVSSPEENLAYLTMSKIVEDIKNMGKK